MWLAMTFSACGRGVDTENRYVLERQAMPMMTTDSVSTLISDSGITRYRIVAAEWLVYDKTEPPYQEFPSGVYLEQFDTPELIWEQKEHRVWSDSVIHITRETSIIHGIGFESNEEMSKYTILHPTGVFPINEED